ncbi:MAG: thiamine-phosphate kinase [Rikenellaceae bacterium]
MTEFGFIDNIKSLFAALPLNSFEGIGDDCAVLPISATDSLLFTSDMLVEDIHFTRATTSAFDLGYKSLAVNISDVAAMGATPVASLLSISLPKGIDPAWAEEFMRGYHSLSERHNVALVGGDTTSSTGLVTINVTAIGRAQSQRIKRRADARVGDIILTTGKLGDSACGLRDMLSGSLLTPEADIHRRPTPRIEEGAWLGKRAEVHAMMDISDGVASDLRHIMSQSGVGAQINIDKLPSRHDIRLALCGGEDYELLFTAAPDLVEDLIRHFNARFSCGITPIGEIVSGDELVWREAGTVIDLDLMGFRHF